MLQRALLPAVLALAALPSPAAAKCDVSSFGMDPRCKLFVSPGLTLGGGIPLEGEQRGGFVLGGEVSVIYVSEHLRGMLFGGGYLDGLYGWDRRAGRMSAGGVLGWAFIGLDLGYLADFQPEGPRHGLSVRLFLTYSGLVSAYARYGFLYGTAGIMEFGLLLKIPFSILRNRGGEWKRHLRLFGMIGV